MTRSYLPILAALAVSFTFCASCSRHSVPGKSMSVSAPDGSGPLQQINYRQGDYSLTFRNNDPDFDTAIRNKLVATYFAVYPAEARRFNKNTVKHVIFSVDTAYHGVAATGGGKTTFSSAYYRRFPADIDVVTHEVMHLVQSYPHYHPVWLVEGIADYVRYEYGLHNKSAGWTMPNYNPKQSYKNSYRITARFLVWIQEHGDKKVVDQLDGSLRNNTYDKDTWKKLTGKSVDDWWAEYGKSPSLKLSYR